MITAYVQNKGPERVREWEMRGMSMGREELKTKRDQLQSGDGWEREEVEVKMRRDLHFHIVLQKHTDRKGELILEGLVK